MAIRLPPDDEFTEYIIPGTSAQIQGFVSNDIWAAKKNNNLFANNASAEV